MNPVFLTVKELTIGYVLSRRLRYVVAPRLNASLKVGEVVCLIGPNGAGKSTLLRTIAGLHPPLEGQVYIRDQGIADYTPRDLARMVSVVLTERVTAGLLSVFDLVALGRYAYTDWLGKLEPEDEAIVNWAIQAVGAEALAERHLAELSDGERQKAMIARALAQEPQLIVLDEPTAFLDLPRRVEIMALLKNLARSTGKAIVLSTHDLDLALRSADNIWLLTNPAGENQGAALRTGAPEDLVLSGAVEEAFRNQGVEFDKQHGSFIITRKTRAEVLLNGEGLTALWTRRALERAGFLVRESGTEAGTHENQAPQGKGPGSGQEVPIQVEIGHSANSQSGAGRRSVSTPPGNNGAPGRPRWRLTAGREVSEHDTIYQLISALVDLLRKK